MSVGYTSDVAISVEELSALVQDLSSSSVLVVVAVGAVIVFYYRWWRSIVILVVPLLLATVYAFAIASLPPFNITELNSNTAFLGSIIIGNGINFGIVLLARYVEERRREVPTKRPSSPGLVGAPGDAVGGARGGRRICLAHHHGLPRLPPVRLHRRDRDGAVVARCLRPHAAAHGVAGHERQDSAAPQARAERDHGDDRSLHGAVRPAHRARRVMLTAGAAWSVRNFGVDQLETDMSRLRRADTWTSGEGYWAKRATSS